MNFISIKLIEELFYKRRPIKSCPANIDEMMSECIHCNVNIIRDKQVICIKEWFDNGIVLMRHLVNFNGTFMF